MSDIMLASSCGCAGRALLGVWWVGQGGQKQVAFGGETAPQLRGAHRVGNSPIQGW